MSTVAIPSKARRTLAAVAAVAYAVGLLALAVCGVALWRMYCEGFGCVGKGIAWFAWALGFATAFLVGYVARRSYRGVGHAGVRYLLAVQIAAGIALAIHWAAWRAA